MPGKHNAKGGAADKETSQQKARRALKGTIYLNGQLIIALFDTGASLSVISTSLVKAMNLEVKYMIDVYVVKTAGNEVLFTYHMVKNCEIQID